MKLLSMTLALMAVAAIPAWAGTIYLDDSTGSLYAGDPTAASPTYTYIGTDPTAAVFGGFTDIAFASTGVLYGLSPVGELYTIDPTTGLISSDVGSTGITDGSLVGLAGDSSGNLYAGGAGAVYEITPTISATATSLGTSGNGYTTSGDLDFDGSGNLWLTSTTPVADSLYEIDVVDGSGTNAGTLPYANVFGVAYDTDNGVLYGFQAGDVQFDINTANPSASASSESFGITGTPGTLLGATFIATPEPPALGLMVAGSGLLLLGAVRRRKSTSAV